MDEFFEAVDCFFHQYQQLKYYTYLKLSQIQYNNFIKSYHKKLPMKANKIDEYNELVQNLNPFGRFQFRIYALCIIYWGLNGFIKTIFNISYPHTCPYSKAFGEFLGLILISRISIKVGYKRAGYIAGLLLAIGFILIVVGQFLNIDTLMTVGITIFGLSVLSRPVLLFSIVTQYTTINITQLVVISSIGCFSMFKLLSVFVLNYFGEIKEPNQQSTLYFLIFPIFIIDFGLWYFVQDSPRYWIQNDVSSAEELVKKISRINKMDSETIMKNIEESFIIKLINIRIYDFSLLFKYSSFGFPQYCLLVLMFLIGITYNFPCYIIFNAKGAGRSPMQIIWDSSFQLIGTLTTFFSIKIGYRRLYLIIVSFLIATSSTSIFFVHHYCPEGATYCDFLGLTALGINAVFSITLYVFMIINAIEFYPHTMRVLGLSVAIGLFYLGKLVYDIFLVSAEPSQEQKMEIFLCGSWIMVMHSFKIPQTFKKGFKYEIEQIQEEQNDEI